MLNKSAWKGLVKEAYAAKNKSGLSEDTLRRVCVKLSKEKGFPGSKDERTESFLQFLKASRAKGRLQVRDGRVYQETPRNPSLKQEHEPKASEPSEQPRGPIPSSASPVQPQAKERKKKRKHPEPAPPAAASEEAAPPAPAGLPASPKPKKQRKRKSRPEGAPEPQEAAPNSPPQEGLPEVPQDPLRAKKKRKSKKGSAEGEAPESNAEGAGATHGSRRFRFEGREDPMAMATWREDSLRTDVKRGQFSKKEKEVLQSAITAFAQKHQLSQEDLSWLFSTKRGHKKNDDNFFGGFQEIALSLPHRTRKAVYACSTRMMHTGNYKGLWSLEEDRELLRMVEQNGKMWSHIGGVLGRLPEGCRDRWKEIRLGGSLRKGPWQPDEIARLKTSVETYNSLRNTDEPELPDDVPEGSVPASVSSAVVGGRIVLDRIDWQFVSTQVGTRSNLQCMVKWYSALSPSMVATGAWGIGDDRRMLKALLEADPAEEYEVDWEDLVEGRNASQTKRRWRLMLKCVPDHRDKELPEIIRFLVETYTPNLLGTPAGAKSDPEGGDSDSDSDADSELIKEGL